MDVKLNPLCLDAGIGNVLDSKYHKFGWNEKSLH